MACDPSEVITSIELTGLKADISTIDDVVESRPRYHNNQKRESNKYFAGSA